MLRRESENRVEPCLVTLGCAKQYDRNNSNVVFCHTASYRLILKTAALQSHY